MRGAEEILAAARAGDLSIEVAAISGWYDGPTEGLARLSGDDDLWVFSILADDLDPDSVGSRLFTVGRLDPGDLSSHLATLLTGGERPPLWPFDECPDPARMRELVHAALAAAVPFRLVLLTTDLVRVQGAWITFQGA